MSELYKLCGDKLIVIAGVFITVSVLSTAFAATPRVIFDHSTARDQIAPVSAESGDTLRVTIDNTCPGPGGFSYASAGATAPATPPPPPQQTPPHVRSTFNPALPQLTKAQLGARFSKHYCSMSSHDVFIVYDSRYGGYVITVTDTNEATLFGLSKDDFQSALTQLYNDYNVAYAQKHCGRANNSCSNAELVRQALDETSNHMDLHSHAKALRPVVETVVVTNPGHYVEFAGGITLSQLTDPRFALAPNAGGSALPQVVEEDRQAEDSWNVGFAGFMHVHDPNCTWWECQHFAMSLGLGISKDSNVSVFIGPSYRLAGKWFVTAGYNWGQIDTLPKGDRVGQPPQGANDLNNLGSRTGGGFFFSFSYAFLNPGNSFFKKPFDNTPTVTQSAQ